MTKLHVISRTMMTKHGNSSLKAISMTTNAQIPEDFQTQVKEALENLYDYPKLQTHPFATSLKQQEPNNRDNPAHWLRRLIIEAIETLNLNNAQGIRSGASRVYNLLHMHYVGGMTLQEVGLELGISVRQAYRDLKKGQDSVTSILWYKLKQNETVVKDPKRETMDSLSTVQSEVTQVEGDIQAINIAELLESVAQSLHTLAEQLNVPITFDVLETVMVSTNPTIARQVLMGILSKAIQQTQSALAICLDETEKYVSLEIDYSEPLEAEIVTPVIKQFVEQLGWQLEHNSHGAKIRVTHTNVTVLLIDDNKGLVDLMKRYLGSESYQVLTAYNGLDGLKLAIDAQPDVIVMDIMMPEMDGWEMLQRLRTSPVTDDIPIVICSVMNDPQLAFSLGASKFITKPVSKDNLFQALDELNL